MIQTILAIIGILIFTAMTLSGFAKEKLATFQQYPWLGSK